MAISINKVPEETQNKIINDYKNGKSLRQIEKDYGVARTTVSKFLTKIGVKNTVGNHHRTYYHNEDYFEVIDNEHKAYWLGFMFADGYISNNDNRYGEDQFGISLAKEDIQTLYQFKQDINATNPIHEYERKNNIGQPLCRIQLTSQKTVDDLINKGCIKQKSHILNPPKNISNELLPHFLRGFFDGDGSIIKTKSKYNIKTDGYSYSINITTTKDMAEWIQAYVEMGSVVKESRREYTWYYSLGGHIQVINFYHLLYDNATIYMGRKYLRFQELLNKYNESQGN